jgi:hypothetical protein
MRILIRVLSSKIIADPDPKTAKTSVLRSGWGPIQLNWKTKFEGGPKGPQKKEIVTFSL